jgi:hypothetical protein
MLKCTRKALLKLIKLKRYKKSKYAQVKNLGPIDFINIQQEEAEDVDLDDITSFLEKDVELYKSERVNPYSQVVTYKSV